MPQPVQGTTPFFIAPYRLQEDQSPVKSSVERSAQKALLQLGAALSLNYAIQVYTATPLSFVSSAMLSVNLFQVSLCAVSVYLVAKVALHLYQGNQSSYSSIADVIQDTLSGKLEMLSLMSIINLFQLAGPHFWIHEGGHALAALACFLKANPRIAVTPFTSGSTDFAISYGLTSLGRLLGKDRSLLVIFAAGITATAAAACARLGVAQYLHESHPHVSQILEAFSMNGILNDALYGILALGPERYNPTHDLSILWEDGGIHPLLPLALLILLPMMQHWRGRGAEPEATSRQILQTA